MNKKFFITVITLAFIILGAGIAVLLTKGYIFSPKEGKVVGTGIISATSSPDGASVYLDGHLTTATNTTIPQLPTKVYSVKIVKEGFIPWEKQIEVKEGLVSEIKATLFPSIPTIYPLTFSGVKNPVLSEDGQKLAFAVPLSTESGRLKQRGGIWIWTMGSAPIAFSRSSEPHQIIASTPSLDFSKASLRFSPNAKQILVSLQEGDWPGEANTRNFLLSADQFTQTADAQDITAFLSSTLKTWEDDEKTKDEGRILAIVDSRIKKVASSAAMIKWSPDETKFMVLDDGEEKVKDRKTKDKIKPELAAKVYDLAFQKNYDLPAAKDYLWLPDSKHIIVVRENNLAIADFDGSNIAVVYGGRFEDGWVFPWLDSSRLVIMTSFDTPTASQPNLFGINLK